MKDKRTLTSLKEKDIKRHNFTSQISLDRTLKKRFSENYGVGGDVPADYHCTKGTHRHRNDENVPGGTEYSPNDALFIHRLRDARTC